jgi:alcohol dehydrogenase, propanol-preferring
MHAMVLRARGAPLILEERPDPVVCGGIYMSDIPSFPYNILWEERQLVSVANLTRHDAATFLPLAQKAKIQTSTTRYPLHAANKSVSDLRNGRIQGAAVLVAT